MAQLAGCARYRPDDMILEGGSITVDGEGTVIVTDQCLLSPGRTASAVLAEEADEDTIWPAYAKKFQPWSEELRAYMDEHLKAYLGVEKVVWVKEGIDPEETNGHIDDVATFIAPGVVAVIWHRRSGLPLLPPVPRGLRHPGRGDRRQGPPAEGVQAAHAGEAPVHVTRPPATPSMSTRTLSRAWPTSR